MVEDVWKLVIEAQDHQCALAGAPVGIPFVLILPGCSSLKMDTLTREPVTLEFNLMLLYPICGYGLPPTIFIVETEDLYHCRMVGRWGTLNCCLLSPVGCGL
jgi:hypothetical protein